MGFTGRLGYTDSQPGNIELGIDLSAQSFTKNVSDTLSLNDSATENVDFARTVTDTMSLSGIVSGGTDLDINVNQTLLFSDGVDVEHDVPESPTNTLAFSQLVTLHVEYARTLSDTLSLTSGATQGSVFERTTIDTLSLSDGGSGGLDKPESASNTLSFSEDIEINFKFGVVSQTLTFDEDIDVIGPVYINVDQALNLAQDENGHGGSQKAVSDFLVFAQLAGRTIEQSVTQSLAFTQAAERRNLVLQTISFVQTIHFGKGGDAEDTLEFTEALTSESLFPRHVSDALAINQGVTFYVIHTCSNKQYNPFVGAGSGDITPPPTSAPTLGHNNLTLTYPFVSPSTTLVLRNPEFSNKDRLNFNRINRETRGGTLIVFADPKWPKSQTYSIQIDNLKQSQVNNLLDFLGQALGQEIGFLDWENRQWRGIITTPDAQVTHVGTNDRSVVFDFMGTLV